MNYQYHNYDIITNIDNVKDIMKEIKSSPIKNEDNNDNNNNNNLLSLNQLALVAQKARHHLKLLSDKSKYECGNANLFKPYDTYKSNVITYDDLNSSLIRSNANISTKDAYDLASALDKNEAGIIHYDNILSALKEIEDQGGIHNRIEPTSSTTTTTINNEKSHHILSAEARDILNRLKSNPYTFDQTTVSHKSLSPKVDNIDNNDNNENIDFYPPTYESYIKKNPDYHEFLSHPRRHIKQINDIQYDLYRPAPYYHDDIYTGTFPPRPNKDIKERRFRSQSTPPPNQIKSLAFEEKNITKTVTPTKSSPKSLYEQLMLAKTKNLGDYTEQLGNSIINNNNKNSISDIVSSPIVKESSLTATTQSSRKKEIVNSLITQLKGKLMPLRIQLNKFDCSKSGLVNLNEFVAALGSTGIVAPRKQLIELFKESSHRVDDTSKGHYGVYENSYAVKIDDFISTMQEKSYNPHNGLVSDNDRMKNKMREDSRIFKKLLHATEKIGGDIHRYFLNQDADYCGWIQPTKLKEAFRHLGANVTEDEFNKIVNKLDKSDKGLINVHNLDTALNKYVHDYDISSYDNAIAERSSHTRYSDTYRPQHYHGKINNEYDEIRRAKLIRKERMQWAKLRNKLVTSYDVLNKVFSSSPDKNVDFFDRRIDVSDIQRNLARAGIQLGSDDTNRFKAHLQDFKRSISKDSTSDSYVSAKELCEFLDPKYSHKDLKSIDPDKIEEGGLFSSYLRVPHSGSGSFDSSFFDSNNVFEKSLGPKRRKKLDSRVTDPSRYWLLEHESVMNPEFKFGQTFIPAFFTQKSNDKTVDLRSASNIQLASNMLKQPYHSLNRGVANQHQYGRRNSTQKSFISQESSGEQQGPYKSVRKLKLPLNTNDSLNDSIGSYSSSDSRDSRYDINQWAAKSLADFMAAKKSLGLTSMENETPKQATRVRFDTSVENSNNSNNNIYMNQSQGKTMRGGLKKSNNSSPNSNDNDN